MRTVFYILTMYLCQVLSAQTWKMEAEDPASSVEWKDGTATIIAPGGVTLWCEQLMEGNTVIEYEARIVPDRRFKTDAGTLRISDLNCFWMADSCGGHGGRFVDNYALRLYYMGYGGNWNTTTRFRRYTGDVRGVDSAAYRPPILKEYTDAPHLLKANRWYKIRLEQKDGHARYFIDGELLVDYVDPQPLTSGYFGFRTTAAKAQLRRFHYTCEPADPIVLRWIGNKGCGPVTWGVPFDKGELSGQTFSLKTGDGTELPFDTWRLASWPDGSCKWQAFCAVVAEGTDSLLLSKREGGRSTSPEDSSAPTAKRLYGDDVEAVRQSWYDERMFTITLNGKTTPVLSHEIESHGNIRTVHKFTGQNFILRAYTYRGSNEMKLVHTLLVDSALNHDGLSELSIHFRVPMHGAAYERFVRFDDNHPMSVQPLLARRPIDLAAMDSVTRSMLAGIAQWDGFRLSQLSPGSYSIRKRATSLSPWIGTIEGTRSQGIVTIGDSTSQTAFRLKDFWQSYPSTLQVSDARSDTATVTVSLYSPEAETYSFAHYDTIPHTLEAAYEDVQPGMSTAWGIARTSTIIISTDPGSHAAELSALAPTPTYLHAKRAFGIWSLPTRETPRDSLVENTLDSVMAFYAREIERNHWYGFFNYGDVMHAYDASRDEWRYDVGGYAWDNTELGSPAMLWYQFLRTGSPDVWRMAEAMTRHCSEVDTYHFGPHAGLGSRHNVTHWGCGAKEARISEAWWNRFYYYLTADERIGDIMHEVADADTLLYALDPMRLAQPRGLYPCTAPARLRLGPDWFAYASNWLTEWERTPLQSPQERGNTHPLPQGESLPTGRREGAAGRLLAGMNSIASFPHGFFEGPLALGYDPATGIITTEAEPRFETTNHLMTIMGGFELMNELQSVTDHPQFFHKWLLLCRDYKWKAAAIRHNHFSIPRLAAYAGWRLGDDKLKAQAWDDLLRHLPFANRQTIWTNDCATWTMDAIFMKETINK